MTEPLRSNGPRPKPRRIAGGAALRFLAFALPFAALWLAFYAVWKAFPYLKPGSEVIYEAKVKALAREDVFRADTKLRVVMVGNSLKSDVAPALELGIQAIWMNREGRRGDRSVVPSAEIGSLAELRRIVH